MLRVDGFLHPGVELRTNLKSISHRCHIFEMAFVWELTKDTIHLPLGCLQGGLLLTGAAFWLRVDGCLLPPGRRSLRRGAPTKRAAAPIPLCPPPPRRLPGTTAPGGPAGDARLDRPPWAGGLPRTWIGRKMPPCFPPLRTPHTSSSWVTPHRGSSSPPSPGSLPPVAPFAPEQGAKCFLGRVTGRRCSSKQILPEWTRDSRGRKKPG